MKTEAEIRMRGFLRRTPVPELLDLIRKYCLPLEKETVDLKPVSYTHLTLPTMFEV